MRFRYWPDREPEGEVPALDLTPFVPGSTGWGDNLKNLGEDVEELWGRHRKHRYLHTVFVRMDNKLANRGILAGPGGKITNESLAHHLFYGCNNWHRLTPWVHAVCQTILDAGYYFDFLALDIENPKCTRTSVYDDISIRGIVQYMIDNDMKPGDWPQFDNNVFQSDRNPYTRANYDVRTVQFIWREYVIGNMAKRLTEVFHNTANRIMPCPVTTVNFDFCEQAKARMAPAARYIANASIGGASSPAIYLQDWRFGSNVDFALASCDTIQGTNVHPWFILPDYDHGPDYPHHANEENTARLHKGWRERGYSNAIGW